MPAGGAALDQLVRDRAAADCATATVVVGVRSGKDLIGSKVASTWPKESPPSCRTPMVLALLKGASASTWQYLYGTATPRPHAEARDALTLACRPGQRFAAIVPKGTSSADIETVTRSASTWMLGCTVDVLEATGGLPAGQTVIVALPGAGSGPSPFVDIGAVVQSRQATPSPPSCGAARRTDAPPQLIRDVFEGSTERGGILEMSKGGGRKVIQKTTLGETGGSGYVAGFWATWCESCKKEPELALVARLAAATQAAGGRYLNVCAEGSDAVTSRKVQDGIQSTIDKVGKDLFTWPVFVVAMFPEKLPLFIAVKDGKLVDWQQGVLDDASVVRLAGSLSAGVASGQGGDVQEPYARALVHVDRGEWAKAASALESAGMTCPDPTLSASLAFARSRAGIGVTTGPASIPGDTRPTDVASQGGPRDTKTGPDPVESATLTSRPVTVEGAGEPSHTGAWVAGSVAAACIVTGATLAIIAAGHEADLADAVGSGGAVPTNKLTHKRALELRDERDTFQTAGYALIGAGAAVGITTLILELTRENSPRQAGDVVPLVSPTSIGAQVTF